MIKRAAESEGSENRPKSRKLRDLGHPRSFSPFEPSEPLFNYDLRFLGGKLSSELALFMRDFDHSEGVRRFG